MVFPVTHLSLPMEAVPPSVSRRGVAHPRYPIATESALQSPVCLWQEQPRCFPLQSVRFVSLFCRQDFREQRAAIAPAGTKRPDLSSVIPTQGRLRLHTALRHPQAPMHRIAGFSSVSYTARKYHAGSTAMHKNRSPRKQGRGNHAIGNRPESASAHSALPPSTHPTLGVSSRHQRFHRCALQRIFSPSFGNGRSD